ncbi:hypothetical protein Vretifemale_14698 [Volvox reticuliferus]|uniref:Uncharacterized protein n=1 Tax=Volvox reticuliferus TaxID=1737510 RepID=A0A8J4FRU1_9CHLO|nr:hypothetical protein Vretifemale_14698 [Volvox reticuliferus]
MMLHPPSLPAPTAAPATPWSAVVLTPPPLAPFPFVVQAPRAPSASLPTSGNAEATLTIGPSSSPTAAVTVPTTSASPPTDWCLPLVLLPGSSSRLPPQPPPTPSSPPTPIMTTSSFCPTALLAAAWLPSPTCTPLPPIR